jgi:NAD(P)-dependent dehydrogenase (short-subunit alcohol dehydrogenase family)
MGKMGMSAEALKGFEEHIASKTLVKRYGQPVEVARLARFLLSEDSSFIIGEDVLIDGGMNLS